MVFNGFELVVVCACVCVLLCVWSYPVSSIYFGCIEQHTVPVLRVCDGVDDGVVDGRGLGDNSRNRMHIWCDFVCIARRRERETYRLHINKSPSSKEPEHLQRNTMASV